MLYRGARRKETTPSMLGFHISAAKYPPSMFSSSTSKRIKTETLVSQALRHFRSMTFPPVSSSCFSFLPEPSSEQPLHLNPIQVLFRDAEVLSEKTNTFCKAVFFSFGLIRISSNSPCLVMWAFPGSQNSSSSHLLLCGYSGVWWEPAKVLMWWKHSLWWLLQSYNPIHEDVTAWSNHPPQRC